MEFLILDSVEDYKEYYKKEYCDKKIYTFSGIEVRFYADNFEHAFYESRNYQKRDKSVFSVERAKRMSWIKKVLEDKKAELYVGWDRDKRKLNDKRRVSIISKDNYVVILNMITENRAKFITAYPASRTNAELIRKHPKWTKK